MFLGKFNWSKVPAKYFPVQNPTYFCLIHRDIFLYKIDLLFQLCCLLGYSLPMNECYIIDCVLLDCDVV